MSRIDDVNPYEAPRSEAGRFIEELPSRAPAPRFTVGDVTARGWEVFKANMGLCIGLAFLPSIINFGMQIGVTAFQAALGSGLNDQRVVGALGLVFSLATTLISVWISIGQSVGYLNVVRGREGSVGDLFKGGPFFVPVILGWLVLSLVGAGIMLLGAAPGGAMLAVMGRQDTTALLVLGVGVLVAAAVILLYSIYISQFIYLAIDHPGLGAMGAIRESMRITRGRIGTMAGIFIVATLINLGGLLMLVIGLLFTIPLTATILAVMYTALVGKMPAVDKPVADAYEDL